MRTSYRTKFIILNFVFETFKIYNISGRVGRRREKIKLEQAATIVGDDSVDEQRTVRDGRQSV